MNTLIRTELRKVRSTRAPRNTIIGVLAFVAFLAFALMADVGSGARGTPASDAPDMLRLGPGLLVPIALLLFGAVGAAGEFQHRTITGTFLLTPKRGRVLAAKLWAYGLLGAGVAAVATAISFPISLMVASGNDVHVASGGELVGLALAIVAAGAAAAVCGVAAGMVLRNQTTAILGILGWVIVAERLLGLPVLPFNSLLTTVGLAGTDGPPASLGFAVLVAWSALLAAVSHRWFLARDIS